MILLIIFTAALLLLSIPQPVHAIIILPALILIPLAKLVAIVVAAFGIPATSLGVLISKITRNKKLAIIVTLVFILLIALSTAIVFKIANPNRPWF